MESRVCIFLLRAACVLALPGVLGGCSFLRTADDEPVYSEAEPVIKPDIERRTITEADIDAEDFEVGAYVGVLSIEDFGSNIVYGVRGDYHITEDFFAEVALGMSTAGETSYETLSGGAQILTDSQRDFMYYNISVGYNLLPGESFVGSKHAFNSALYLIAGVGNTEFADDSHFTINVGAGYRFLINDWIAARLDIKDYIFDSDLLGTDKTTHNLEATAGLSVFF
jgi:outer membrane beta-barrel protein